MTCKVLFEADHKREISRIVKIGGKEYIDIIKCINEYFSENLTTVLGTLLLELNYDEIFKTLLKGRRRYRGKRIISLHCVGKGMPELRKEDETAVHRFAALQMRRKLEKGYGLF